jgi:splicing suppressor protein 51
MCSGRHARAGFPARSTRCRLRSGRVAARAGERFLSLFMSLQRLGRSPAQRIVRVHAYGLCHRQQSRGLLNVFKRWANKLEKPDPVPLLSQDDLFHPFSKSPFPAVRARGETIRCLAPCPVCADDHEVDLEIPKRSHTQPVTFECPDCGWPTHCSEEHWKQDTEHEKHCSRLREVNEDEHDLRSGRRLREFELPRAWLLALFVHTL